MAIVVSAVLTILAIIGIAEKDRPEYFGLGGEQEKVALKDYVEILKNNTELLRLMVAGAGCKLAFSIATNMTVLCMPYGAMMNNYDGFCMLTDSRAFTSFGRHEYFRRILCNKLGTLVEDGQYPCDMETLGEIVENICWKNAVNYFKFDV